MHAVIRRLAHAPTLAVVVALALGLGLLSAPGRARGAPSVDVRRARGEYERGNYEKTAAILHQLLYVEKAALPEAELIEAHKLLGISYFFLDQPEKAREEFSALLYIDPDYELDPVIEDAAVVAFFDTLKRELRNELADIRRKRALDEAKKQQPKQVLIVSEVKEPNGIVNWIPGAGQFRNGQPKKGWAFVIADTALLGTSAALFTYQALKYGVPGRLPRDPSEIDTIRTLQVVQIGTGALGIVVYLWGVLDAYGNQRTVHRYRPATEKEMRQLNLGTGAGAARVVPFWTPDAVGLGATWEF